MYCHKASPLGFTHPGCMRRGGIDGFTAIFFYNPLMKKIVKAIKYRLSREVFEELTQVIKPGTLKSLSQLAKFDSGFVICPLPLHERRLRSRGFNQAELLGSFVNKFVESPKVQFLMRTKDTPSQTSLKDGLKRYQNVRGAFHVRKPTAVRGKSILLVDDVVTTGATAREAARTLKRAGAAKVFVFALAKG